MRRAEKETGIRKIHITALVVVSLGLFTLPQAASAVCSFECQQIDGNCWECVDTGAYTGRECYWIPPCTCFYGGGPACEAVVVNEVAAQEPPEPTFLRHESTQCVATD